MTDIKSYPQPSEYVREYYSTAGITPDPELSKDLIWEEYKEWRHEVSEMFRCEHNRYDPRDELKELADLVYVIYGYALSRGWNIDEALYRVHSNNLGRMTQPDGTIKRREDGKILKNKDYPKVYLEDCV